MKKIITLSLVAATLLFTACGEKTDEKTAKAVESTKAAAHDIAEASKEAANAAIAKAKEATAKAKEAVESTKEAAVKAIEKTDAAVNAATAAAIESVVTSDGKDAYAKCAVCHGVDGKTKALGKSAEIAGVDKAALVEMLKAYKAGTRNQAGMGKLMQVQVAKMDDATIEAVATYISTLK